MISKCLGIGLPCGIALLLIVGAAQASGRNPTRVLRFHDTAGVDTLVGASPSGKPAIGEQDILTLRPPERRDAVRQCRLGARGSPLSLAACTLPRRCASGICRRSWR